MVHRNATNLHISAGSAPLYRVDGKLIRMPMKPISEDLSRVLGYSLMSKKQQRRFEKDLDIDFSVGVRGLSRFRCNVFHQRGTVAVVIKHVSYEDGPVGDLHIPHEVYEYGGVTQGLVLVTGPRGSGKSTTLSAILNKLNHDRKQHILTIEDPVENIYSSKNCIFNQRELYSDTKSYDIALKSAPRQNPDIVFVSEVNEEIKLLSTLKVADTGLLVFASMKARDAASSVMRMVDLGLPLYLINGSLRFVIAQRLLRMICPYCKRVITPDNSLLRLVGLDQNKAKNVTFYRGTGCPKCNGTGYYGRIPVFEMLRITTRVHNMIKSGTSVIDLWKDAVKSGMVPLRKTALRYMLKGVTTLEQVATETISYQ